MAVATSTIIALAVAAAASAASAYNTKQTADKADQANAAGIRRQAENQREVNARLNKTIGEVGASTAEPERAKATDSYLSQVQASLAKANQGLQQRGISKEFDDLAGGTAAADAAYGGDTAKLLGRIDAGKMQRQDEGNSFGKLGEDLSILGGNIKGDAFLNQMKLAGIRRNPYIDLAAGILGGSAGAIGGGAGGASGSAGMAGGALGGAAGAGSGVAAYGGAGGGY